MQMLSPAIWLSSVCTCLFAGLFLCLSVSLSYFLLCLCHYVYLINISFSVSVDMLVFVLSVSVQHHLLKFLQGQMNYCLTSVCSCISLSVVHPQSVCSLAFLSEIGSKVHKYNFHPPPTLQKLILTNTLRCVL